MKKYQYLLFDLDNTLLDFSKTERIAIEYIFDLCKIDISFFSLYTDINKGLWRELELGKIEREVLKVKRFQILFDKIGIKNIDAYEISEKYMEYMSNLFIPFDDTELVLKKLKKEGYKLYIITNGSALIQNKKYKNSFLKDYFEGMFISEEIGYNKPDIKYFDYVLSSIFAEKENCLIIGDSLSSDILGGLNSQIDTCFVNIENIVDTSYAQPTYTINGLKQIFSILEIGNEH